MSLPQVAQLEVNTEKGQSQDSTVHKTLLWDFTNGEFFLKDGKTIEIEGKEYLKVWIKKALLSRKNTLIYQGTDYGSEHQNLIGKNFKPSFTAEELKRMIRETLLLNTAITNVTNFEFTQEGSMVMVKFVVRSIFGDIDGEVVI